MLLKSTTRMSNILNRASVSKRLFSAAAAGSAHHDTEMYDKLVQASFLHAKSVGFNDHAISKACRDLELPSTAGSIIKGGAYEVVEFAMKQWLHDMTEDLASYNELDSNGQLCNFSEMETHKQLRAGVKTRLE